MALYRSLLISTIAITIMASTNGRKAIAERRYMLLTNSYQRNSAVNDYQHYFYKESECLPSKVSEGNDSVRVEIHGS